MFNSFTVTAFQFVILDLADVSGKRKISNCVKIC